MKLINYGTIKPEKRHAYIILSIFVTVIAAYLATPFILSLPLDFDPILKSIPGHYKNDDTGRSICEIIESRGFICQTHYVTSSDGYILTLHRIVNPTIVDTSKKLKPILLQHGYQNMASVWIINTSGRLTDDGQYVEDSIKGKIGNTLGFVLASSGYDVWMGNFRGNAYSLNHTHLNSDRDEKFWHFSIDEIIKYDMPAIINYILQQTSQKTISYIGHSQGTFVMFGLLSEKPEYSSVIKPFIALSPTPFLGHNKSILRHGRFFQFILKYRWRTMHWSREFQYTLSRICENYYMQYLCFQINYLILGHDSNQYDSSRTGVYMFNLPAGSSSRNSLHLLQKIKYKKPTKYDHGPEENLQLYGQELPPVYDMSAINSTNIAIIYTANDWLNDLKDVNLLKQHLKVPLLDDYLVPDHRWNHMELLWAKETGKYVNSRIMKILKKFN